MGERENWEYLTVILESNVDVAPVPMRDDIPLQEHPKYSHYTLIPQLNRYGDDGWELVTMEPVTVGKNGDVIPPVAGAYGRHYFCAFKRRL